MAESACDAPADPATSSQGGTPVCGDKLRDAEPETWPALLVTCLETHAPELDRCHSTCRALSAVAAASRQLSPEELWRRDPGARRGPVWKSYLLGGVALHAKSPKDAYGRLKDTESPFDSVIRRDVGRTLPEEPLFRDKGGPGQSALFRVLRALALRLEDIGYTQSLNFVAATLIAVFPDDEAAAFHCALALLLRYSLVDLYKPKFPKLGVTVWQMDKVVEGFLPKIHAALTTHGASAEYYALQWFLTLFASDLPQDLVRRVWDRFLVAGWQVVVQVSLALLYSIQDELPEMETCQALSFLKRFPRAGTYKVEDFMRTAASFEVSHKMLSALEVAYGWDGTIQLFVLKDLNSGEVHWKVQSLPREDAPGEEGEAIDGQEPMVTPETSLSRPRDGGITGGIPKAFHRPASPRRGPTIDTEPLRPEGEGQGTVQPFLVRNLDTGESGLMQTEWQEYVTEAQTASAQRVTPSQRDSQASSAATPTGRRSWLPRLPFGSSG